MQGPFITALSHIPPFRALVIEDHDFQRSIAAQVLKLCGAIGVGEAANGAAAIAAIDKAADPFDVLVCDLNMPDMDGLEFLRHMGKRHCSSSVIIVSGLDEAITRSAEAMGQIYGVRLLGAMEKPITRSKLVPLLLRHFGQQRMPSHSQTEPIPIAEIEKGLEEHQFVPFFQPKIDMRQRRLAGVEALMRWHHPERGVLTPDAFIAIMEKNGLITRGTYEILDSALASCRYWDGYGHTVPLAINVSVESLSDTSLPEQLEARVQAVNLAPELVTVEVTESTAMTDLGHCLETLARLRMKGFGLSIDDYGTGFSSMQQLTRIPFSELKIDQTFVTGSARQPLLRALLESSVNMGRRLGLKTVAEGVESDEDWDVVERAGCDVAQGYFIAKPMPAAELLTWYEGWLEQHAGTSVRRSDR
jgi:EAL domain-containing protein (putative c-di-GMP-specific phosphodiesterase class I)/FixJ family two-component response regulator